MTDGSRSHADPAAEWLEADGLGGYASGTAGGIRTRRYHALLLVATAPPTGRMVLVNGVEAWADGPHGTAALTSQRYQGGIVFPDGASRRTDFRPDPWPRWTIALPDGNAVAQEVIVPHGRAAVLLRWRLVQPAPEIRLRVRPLLSGRDYHALHHENPAFRFDAAVEGEQVTWRPYDGVPAVVVRTNGTYAHQPDWYRRFLYTEEEARGLDCVEDLAAPGVFAFDLSAGAATMLVATDAVDVDAARIVADEAARRQRFASRLHRAADAYLVRRGTGQTIIAGYPWFTDWGRDTFIALRGLCLATGRIDDARSILAQWADAVSDGMLPNRFPDSGATPEFNAVDASLWFVVAVDALLRTTSVAAPDRRVLEDAVAAVVAGYAAGTRHGIRADADGLLAAGEPGVQLTWMDAKVGDWVVTPRIGKPVEVQALWINALRIAGRTSSRWAALAERAEAAFAARFWNAAAGCLYDVVDVDHRAGTVDATLRPNQILAVGGLPHPVVTGDRARRIVDVVERHLWTPLGLRSLSPTEPGYVGHYTGSPHDRDAAYHQGTVWPWLLGPFVDAWLRVTGDTPATRKTAHDRFLAPMLAHLGKAGLGHVSEIADGDSPHTPRGCPFQAWSLGEALRLAKLLGE